MLTTDKVTFSFNFCPKLLPLSWYYLGFHKVYRFRKTISQKRVVKCTVFGQKKTNYIVKYGTCTYTLNLLVRNRSNKAATGNASPRRRHTDDGAGCARRLYV